MKPGRFPGRLLIFASLLWRLPGQCLRSRPATATVGRILVLHQFLLGDALMATSLLAKLRQQFPLAQIVLACPPLQAPLYQERPYGIQILAWHPRDFSSIRRLFAQPRFDLVYLMGENRLSYLARAMGARWIIGFAGERPAYKNWLVDQAIPYAQQPECWSESAARLVEGPGANRNCRLCRRTMWCCTSEPAAPPNCGPAPIGANWRRRCAARDDTFSGHAAPANRR
jgi:hypothetical protein